MLSFLLKNKIGVFIVVIIVSAIIFYSQVNNKQDDNLPTVSVINVATSSMSDYVSFSGIVKPYSEVDISAKTSGRVSEMNMAIGDRVHAGELLAELDGNTDKATVSSLEENLFAVKKTTGAIEDLYVERIKSAVESLSLVKQIDATSSNSINNTKSISLITGVAILTSQVNDTLSEMLSMRNGIRNYKDVNYYDDLGATSFSTKSKAENSLAKYQVLQSYYQTFFNENILNKNPSNDVVEKGLNLSKELLESAKVALSDSYSMLLYTVVTSTLTENQLNNFKLNVTSLGSQVETNIENVRNTQSEINQTELGLTTLQKERDSKLYEANAQATQIQGQLSVSEAMLDNSLIRAPFDGVITSKVLDVGSVVGFGTPVYHLAQDDIVKVVIGVSDNLINSFREGEDGFVSVDDNEDDKIPAKITKIYPATDPKNNKVTIELEIDNKDHLLKVGSIVRVLLSKNNSVGVISLPRESLISRYGIQYVFVVKDGIVERKIVKVGIQNDSYVEITGGLSLDDVVVKEGGNYLRNGDKVKVLSDIKYESR